MLALSVAVPVTSQIRGSVWGRQPDDLVDKCVVLAIGCHQMFDRSYVPADGAHCPGQSGVGGEHQSMVGASLDGPLPGQDSEVRHVVREQCSSFVYACGQDFRVVEQLPSALDGGEGVVPLFSECDRDPSGVVVVEGEPHAKAAR